MRLRAVPGHAVMTTHHAELTDTRRRALDKLLTGYLECPVKEQADYIARCRRRWPRLSRWLAELIGHSQTVSLLDRSFNHLASEALASSNDQSVQPLETGRRLGPWRVTEPVAQGGMGSVYLGERADGAFELDVAIKLLKLRGRGLGQHLQRECRYLARLDHPGITRLLDAGLDQQAGPFLVMEWVDGQNLGEWIQSTRPNNRRRLDLFEQIVEAIGHAHQRLIVHGDIKPDNIRIKNNGQAKVMDFGVARLLDAGDQSDRVRAMTPAFAAPEQLAGEPVTPHSDIWSLGALLHWLLCGKTLSRHCEDLTSELSCKGVERSVELAAMIGKASATTPEYRYQSCAELIDELHRLRQHHPLRAMPDSRRYRMVRFVRRNPVLVGGITATIIALSAGLTATTSMYLEAERAWRAAAAEQAQADARAAELEQVASFQEQQLGEIDPEQFGAVIRQNLLRQREDMSPQDDHSSTVAALERALAGINFTDAALESLDRTFLDQTRTAINEQFGNQPEIKARLLQSLASTQVALGDHQQAMDPQTTAFEIRRTVLGKSHPETLHSARELGRLHKFLQDYEQALKLVEMAIEGQTEHLGATHPDTLLSKRDMADINSKQQKFDEAEALLRNTLNGQRQVLGNDHPETLMTMNMLGLLFVDRGQPADGIEYLETALEKRRKVLGEQHPHTLISLNNLGITHADLGDFQTAEEIHRQVFYARTKQLGSDHGNTLRSLSNLGFAVQQQGRLEEAESLHRQALEGRIRVLGEAHADSWTSMNHLALTLTSMEQHGEAQALFERALEVAYEHFGPGHRRTLATASNLSTSKQRSGDLEGAARLSGQSARQAVEHLGQKDWVTAAMLMNHARVLKAGGEYRESASQAEAAHEIFARTLGKDHPRTIDCTELLVRVHNQWFKATKDESLRQQARHW